MFKLLAEIQIISLLHVIKIVCSQGLFLFFFILCHLFMLLFSFFFCFISLAAADCCPP